MEQYIKKSALVAEIERRIKSLNKDRDFNYLQIKELEALLSFLNTLETKDVQEPKDKERIREEIERLHEEYRGKKGDADVRRALRTVLFFIDSMQEEPKYKDANNKVAASEKSLTVDIESMIKSYEQRLLNQGSIEPLTNMCLTAFRHGIEIILDELKLKGFKKQGEKKQKQYDIDVLEKPYYERLYFRVSAYSYCS